MDNTTFTGAADASAATEGSGRKDAPRSADSSADAGAKGYQAHQHLAETLHRALQQLRYAAAHRISLEPSVFSAIHDAECDLAAVAADPQRAKVFYEACFLLGAATGFDPVHATPFKNRTERLKQMALEAHDLLRYATRNALDIDDGIRKTLLTVEEAVLTGLPTVQQEVDFQVAYRQLAKATAPVSAASLAASRSRLPFLKHPSRYQPLNLGRFGHLAAFVLVLYLAGLALSFQDVGENGMRRYQDLATQLSAADATLGLLSDSLRGREIEYANVQVPNTQPAMQLAARQALESAREKQQAQLATIHRLKDEYTTLPERLQAWSREPCRHAFSNFICGKEEDTAAIGARLFEAQSMIDRMNKVILPMLLGFLGAYSFVLRSMSRDIAARVFAPFSLLHHVVRLSLGALAGIAVGWFLTPQQFGLGSNAPAWVLAFLAGYGTDSLFDLLDKLVSGFKPPPQASSSVPQPVGNAP